MRGRFPRTVAEFAEHGRRVVSHCENCRAASAIPKHVLTATFGADFDLYDGLSEVRARMTCVSCGAARPRISFYNPADGAGPVSFEDSVTHALELSAFARASAEGPLREPVRGPRPKSRR